MKRLLKVAMVAVVIALALGAMGVAYTSWTDSATVTSTVGTGFLSVAMERDTDANPMYGTAHNGAWWAASWQDANGNFFANQPIPAGTPHMGSNCIIDFTADVLTMTGVNWAPGLVCRADVKIRNTGTMPVVLESFVPPGYQGTNAPLDWMCYDEGPNGTEQTLPITLKPGEARRCSGLIQSLPATADGKHADTFTAVYVAQAHQWNAPAQ